MTETITIQSLKGEQKLPVDYSDDDIIIVDNIKSLAEPNPTRLQMNLIAICQTGKVQVALNGQTLQLGEQQLLLCPPNVTFSDFMFSHDFEFKAIFLTNRILQSFLREKMNVWNEVMYIHKMHVVTMTQQDVLFFSSFYEAVRICIDTPHDYSPYRTEVIQSLIRGGLLGLCGALRQMLPSEAQPRLRQADNLFQRFLDLVGNSPVKHQTVEHYAGQLCITPKYLSTICKKNSGRTANEWITEHVMEDIRYYLKSTDLSIKEVCNLLGFPNPSFFGRYVREHFGMTPTQLRQHA